MHIKLVLNKRILVMLSFFLVAATCNIQAEKLTQSLSEEIISYEMAMKNRNELIKKSPKNNNLPKLVKKKVLSDEESTLYKEAMTYRDALIKEHKKNSLANQWLINIKNNTYQFITDVYQTYSPTIKKQILSRLIKTGGKCAVASMVNKELTFQISFSNDQLPDAISLIIDCTVNAITECIMHDRDDEHFWRNSLLATLKTSKNNLASFTANTQDQMHAKVMTHDGMIIFINSLLETTNKNNKTTKEITQNIIINSIKDFILEGGLSILNEPIFNLIVKMKNYDEKDIKDCIDSLQEPTIITQLAAAIVNSLPKHQ